MPQLYVTKLYLDFRFHSSQYTEVLKSQSVLPISSTLPYQNHFKLLVILPLSKYKISKDINKIVNSDEFEESEVPTSCLLHGVFRNIWLKYFRYTLFKFDSTAVILSWLSEANWENFKLQFQLGFMMTQRFYSRRMTKLEKE